MASPGVFVERVLCVGARKARVQMLLAGERRVAGGWRPPALPQRGVRHLAGLSGVW